MNTSPSSTLDIPESASQADQNGEVHAQSFQVVSFRLADEEYAVDIMLVQEIILMGEITEIPEVPDYVRGLINLRGKVIPIVDLRKRFHLEAGETTEHTRIMVLNNSGTTFGVVVDEVNEVLRIEPKQIEPPPKGVTGLDSSYFKGLVKMEGRIMILLDIESLLSHEDQAKITAGAPVNS